MAIAKEQIRQIIAENDISSVDDVYELLKDGVKDFPQELLEAELDMSSAMRKTKRETPRQTTNGMDIHTKS